MNGHQYEYQCAKRLKSKGFTRVQVTKGSGDQGIDITAYSGGKKYGIQCKYYTSPVGNHAVQEAYAGAKYYNCDVAVVMTNNTFTPSAKELAKKTGVLLWGNDKLPFGINSFWLTKFIGIFICIFVIWGFTVILRVDNMKFPILQAIELIFLLFGALFAIFEHKKWGMSFLSGLLYLLAAFAALILGIFLKEFGKDSIDFTIVAILSFLRSDYLYKKKNGTHIWKSNLQEFINDNFFTIKLNKTVNKINKEEKRLNKLVHTDLYKKVGIYAIRNNTYKSDYIAMILQEDVKKVNDCIQAMIQNGVISMDTFEELGRFSIVMTEQEFLKSINS